jgi:hypothetical protein
MPLKARCSVRQAVPSVAPGVRNWTEKSPSASGVDANSYSSNITEVTAFGGAGIAIPAPDTIQEFRVQTSLYDAQHGRGGGANVNVDTRSGTADLHGSVYYFGRNEALDANNFFANATGVRTQPGCQEENFGAHNPGALWGDRCPGQRNAPFSLFPIKPHGM